MKKKDLLLVASLFLLWVLWPQIDRTLIKPFYPEQEQPAQAESPEPAAVPDDAGVTAASDTSDLSDESDVSDKPEPVALQAPSEMEAMVEEPEEDLPEQTAVLGNDLMEITLSSRGGGIPLAVLKAFRAVNTPDSGPVEISFVDDPALVYGGLPGFGDEYQFAVEEGPEGVVRLSRESASGLTLQREIEVGEGYLISVRDLFVNTTQQPIELAGHTLRTGPMRTPEGETSMYGVALLGADTLSPGGEKVQHWGKKLPKWLKKEPSGMLTKEIRKPVDWVSAKNKYFTQILIPEHGAQGASVHAVRAADNPAPDQVTSAVRFDPATVAPGQAHGRNYTLYLGPKKLSELKELGLHTLRVMELGTGFWGWITPVGEILIRAMNFIHDVLPPYNYGVAIMLMTLIIKIIFWPITHRGTESMRRMQELSPMMKEINEKYKEDPQKKQQKLMEFYKENKINPLGGCLPMFIQIPVFISLFFVLRTAIELRFAGFLWIKDLSEPERLIEFGFKIPIIGWDALNILPILMAVTMVIQMKVAPTSVPTDEKQAQMQSMMMKFMPIMMLVMLYNFASGLALYWSTQNILMIGQQYFYRKRKEKKERLAAESVNG